MLKAIIKGATAEGADGATRGNGGGLENLRKGMGTITQNKTNSLEKNLNHKAIEHLNKAANINCEHVQALLSYGLRMTALPTWTNFAFEDVDGKPLPLPTSLSAVDFVGQDQKYSAPGACLDMRLPENKNVNLLESKALIIIQDQPLAGYRADLMALNFPASGRIYIFADNWVSDKILEDDACHLQNDPGLVPHPDNTFYAHKGDFQIGCIFLIHMTVAAHEILAVSGVKAEQNPIIFASDGGAQSPFAFPFSSYFYELISLNLKKPRARSLKLVAHWLKWDIQLYTELLKKHKATRPALHVFLDSDLRDIPKTSENFKAYVGTVVNLDVDAQHLRALFNMSLFLTQLIRPVSGAEARVEFRQEFSDRFFDAAKFATPSQYKRAVVELTDEFFEKISRPETLNASGEVGVFDQYVKFHSFAARSLELVSDCHYSRMELALIAKAPPGQSASANLESRTKTILSIKAGVRKLIEEEFETMRNSGPPSLVKPTSPALEK